MQEILKKRDRSTSIKLSIITIMAFICCLTLFEIAAHKPGSPEFCARCHSMQPSYNSWKETVFCNAGCLDCHTHDNSGRTLSVEIQDSNCTNTGCHPVERLTSELSAYKEVFVFNHKTHLKEYPTSLKLRCTGCHSYMNSEVSEGEKSKHFGIDENACFVCHFIKGENPLLTTNDKKNVDECSLCHKDMQIKVMIYEKEFDHLKFEKELKVECTNCHFETIRRNNGVDEKSCYYCHTKVPKEYTGADRMHYDHVKEHRVPCSPCHNDIQHKWDDEYIRFVLPERGVDIQDKYLMRASSMSEGTNLNNLSTSPEEQGYIFNDEPYLLQKEIYRGTRGSGYEGDPDPMYLATVNCTACHKDKNLSVDPMVCNTCHEKGFDKTMLEQKEYVTRMLKELSNLLTESKKQGVPKHLIDEARYNYDLIVNDESFGVHNIKYVKDLITHSIDSLASSFNKRL